MGEALGQEIQEPVGLFNNLSSRQEISGMLFPELLGSKIKQPSTTVRYQEGMKAVHFWGDWALSNDWGTDGAQEMSWGVAILGTKKKFSYKNWRKIKAKMAAKRVWKDVLGIKPEFLKSSQQRWRLVLETSTGLNLQSWRRTGSWAGLWENVTT